MKNFEFSQAMWHGVLAANNEFSAFLIMYLLEIFLRNKLPMY
jgi:hypothetical protein